MAKKGKKGPSPAEVARRQKQREASGAIKGNNSWDDCHALNAQCVDLLQQAGALDLVLKQPGVYAAVTDKAMLNENIRLLAKDTNELTQALSRIYDQHKHKNGAARTPDDFALSISLYEQYIQFMEAYRRTCQPVLNHLMEQTAEAEAKLARVEQQIQAEEAEKNKHQDPNNTDPIDVVSKDIPAGERTMTHIKLDENDPNPQGTVEQAMAEHKAA